MFKKGMRILLAAAAVAPILVSSAWAAGQMTIIVNDPSNPYWLTEGNVAKATAELPVRQRTAIVLTYGDGMSNAQVAEILDTTVSAVETLLVRAKQNLRRALSSVIDED